MTPEIAIGFEINGGIIALLAFTLVGYIHMLRKANKQNAEQHKFIIDSVENVRVANEAQHAAERDLKNYREEVSQYLKRPIQVQSILTEDQLKAVSEYVKGDSTSTIPDMPWPSKKVN